MMIKIIEDKLKFQEIHKGSGLSFLQSWEWGEVKSGSWNVRRLVVNKLPVSIFIRKIPVINKEFGYIPRGFNEELDKEMLTDLIDYCRTELKLSHLVVEPNILPSSRTVSDSERDPGSSEAELDSRLSTSLKFRRTSRGNDKVKLFTNVGFRKTGRTLQPNHTNIVDINKEWEEVFGNFNATYRRNIRKATKLNCKCEIIESGEEGVRRFYEIMKAIMARTKYVMHGYSYFEKVWKYMSEAGLAKIFIVSREGKDLGAIFMLYDEKGAYELYGGVKDEGKEYRVGFYLREQTMQDAQKMGKKFYDQWGVAPFKDGEYDKNSELYGISKFKEGFGGENVEFLAQYTCVFNSPSYHFYKLGVWLNNLKIKLSKIRR